MSQALVHGILMGSVYGLIALGLTLIFGIMKVINFGHGSFLMIAMFLSYFGITSLGLHPYVSLLIVVPAMFLIGYGVNKFLVQPVLNKEADVREPVGALLLTASVSIVLDNGILATFGGDYRTIKTSFFRRHRYVLRGYEWSFPRLCFCSLYYCDGYFLLDHE